jgi:hypothetical protein
VVSTTLLFLTLHHFPSHLPALRFAPPQTVLLEVPTRVLPCLAAASGVGVAPEGGAGAADKGADQMGAASAVSPLRLADFLTDSYRMGAFCRGI